MAMFIRSKIIRCGIYTLFIIVHIPILQGEEHSQCPSLAENPICPCYKFKEGVFEISLLLSFVVYYKIIPTLICCFRFIFGVSQCYTYSC